MNVDTLSIYTQKKKIKKDRIGAHRETRVTINWEGMGMEEMRCLARSAILKRLQEQWEVFTPFADVPVPESITVNALDFIRGPLHDTNTTEAPIKARKRADAGVKEMSWLEQALAAMPKEEREKWLETVGGQS